MKRGESLQGCQILLVEDDADLREVLQIALEARGASVLGVGRASDALRNLVTTPIDVVVSDLALGRETGFWLVRKVRELWSDRHLPVVALTGLPLPADRVRTAGFDDVLAKPPNIAALSTSIAALCRTPGHGSHQREQ